MVFQSFSSKLYFLFHDCFPVGISSFVFKMSYIFLAPCLFCFIGNIWLGINGFGLFLVNAIFSFLR